MNMIEQQAMPIQGLSFYMYNYINKLAKRKKNGQAYDLQITTHKTRKD
jgi:hypothetical protein